MFHPGTPVIKPGNLAHTVSSTTNQDLAHKHTYTHITHNFAVMHVLSPEIPCFRALINTSSLEPGAASLHLINYPGKTNQSQSFHHSNKSQEAGHFMGSKVLFLSCFGDCKYGPTLREGSSHKNTHVFTIFHERMNENGSKQYIVPPVL